MTSAFALAAGREPATAGAAARVRAAVEGSESTTEGTIAVGWRGRLATGSTWRCLVVGPIWSAVDPLELLETEGPGGLARLRGRFALAAWRPALGEAIVAVDQLGAGAVFMHDGEELTLATEVRQLLRLLPSRPVPDQAAVVQSLASGSPGRGRTLYEGVLRVAGGTWIEVDSSGWRTHRFWNPRYESPPRLTRSDAVEGVRRALTSAVAARTTGARRPGILLSGGLDSASVAAAASLAGARPLRGYSAVFPAHPSVDERGLIQAVTRKLGFAGREFPVAPESMVLPGIEYMRTWGLPSVSPNLFVHRPLLQAASDDGVDLLLDGQGGDELFGCAFYLLADRLRTGRLGSAVALARRVPGGETSGFGRVVRHLLAEFGLKGAAPPAVHRAARRLRPPEHYAAPWLTAESARVAVEEDATWEWKRLDGPRWWAQLADQLTHQRERMGAHDHLRRKNALAGVEGGHPLLDDLDLIEFVLRLPPELSFDAAVDRPLLRAAMAGLLPDAVRLRAEKSYFNALFEACLEGVDGALVRSLLTGPEAETRAYVRQDVVKAILLDPPAARRPRGWGWALWRLVAGETWLRAEAGRELPAAASALPAKP